MNLKNFLFAFIVFYVSSIHGQTPQNIDSAYNNYFKKTREIPHLHLNKTSFLKGENVWFQAYIFDQNTQNLHKPTSNLYISLYDELGKLKQQQLIRIQNGIGKGNIKIDSSFTNTAYYVKASTNWMKNFNEDLAFSQKIVVLKNIEAKKEEIEKDSFFDFQLFPEGGHIVANTFNRIGILLKDANNKGIQVKKGKIKNQKGEVIDSFETNQFGIGEVFLPFKENQKYIFEAAISEEISMDVATPEVQKLGISINLVNNQKDNNYIVNLLTNSKTLQNIKGKKYRMMIHNSRKFINYDVDFSAKEKVYAFILEKNNIPQGINVITVFNEENTPIVERVFYNESTKLLANPIESSFVSKEGDSLKVRISNNHTQKMFLSSSFLPTETKAYNPTHTIASTLLLNPYVKGNIENPGYYFNEEHKNRITDLDLLLLTQGWSKYNWDDIFNSPPSEKYNFETGIDLTFKINNKVLPSQHVQMEYIDPDTNEYYTIKIPFDENNTYTFYNSFISKNAVLRFGIKSNDNLYKIGPSISYTNNFTYNNINTNQVKDLLKTPDEFSTFSFLSDDYILLSDVIIKSKLKDKNKEDIGGIPMRVVTEPYNYVENLYFGSDPYGMLNINNGNAWSTDFGVNNRFSSFSYVFGSPKFRDYNSFSRPIFSDKTLNDPFVIQLPVGFAKAKEYYAPRYPSYKEDSYLNYGAIFWKPGIEIEANSTLEFTIPKNEQETMLVYFEGVDETGNLISEEVTLKE